MSVIYNCRHCKEEIGRLEVEYVTTTMLGLDELTREEREKMIEYRPNGELYIYAICENCEQSLLEHPNYHALDFFIQ